MSSRFPPARNVQLAEPANDRRGVFEFVCGELERRVHVSRAVARGTVRLGMKQADLAEEHLTKEGMAVMVRRVLPAMLARRGVQKAEAVCNLISKVLEVSPAADFSRGPSLARVRNSGPSGAGRPTRS